MIFDASRKYFSIALLATGVALVGPLLSAETPQAQLKESFRVELLNLINHDRQAHGVAPVALEESLSSFADSYCEKQIRNRTTGHFTIDGLAPYVRYSLAGGNDGVSENAAAWSANYHFPDSSILDMIRKSETSMLSEQPPHDGHRRTLLDPDATHVALGLAWDRGEFRFVQEFVRRYLDWKKPLPRRARLDERVTMEARPLAGTRVEAVSVHYEPLPREISPQLANTIETYALPKSRRDYYANQSHRTDVSSGRRSLANAADQKDALRTAYDGSFTFTVPFREGAGLYTVVVWVSRGTATAAIAASNVSIQVEGGSSPAAYPELGSR